MSPLLLFDYGSLVSPASAARTLGYRPAPRDGPLPATLTGYRREWNVGSSHESHPQRVLTAPGGVAFTGTLAVLGLSPDPGAACNGALYRLSADDLALLAVRERNYALVEVTGAITPAAAGPAPQPAAGAEPVLTYRPLPEAVRRLATAREAGTAVVQRDYASRVVRAFSALGPGQRAAFARTTAPHGLPEQAIEARWPPASDSEARRARR